MAGLSDDKVKELYDHNRRLISEKGEEFGVMLNGAIPFLTPDSKLYWYPSVDLVCCSPIQEDSGVEWGCHRPLFYTEINASGFNTVKKRWRVRRKRMMRTIERVINSE